MKISRIGIKKNEGMFFFAYGIYIFFAILSTSFFYQYFNGIVYRFILIFCLILLAINELISQKYTKKTLVAMGVAIFLLFAFVYSSHLINQFIMVIAFVYCGRKISFKKIAQFTIYLSSTVLAIIILSSKVGFIENYIRTVYSSFYGRERTREYLGFLYSLYGPAILFNLTMLILYIKKQKVSLGECSILILANYWIYRKTDSRLSTWLAICLILICVLLKYNICVIANSKVLKLLLMISYPVTFIMSVVLTLGYNKNVEWMRELNAFLGTRLSLGQKSIMLYGISLLGKRNLEWRGWGLNASGEITKGNYLWVDNAYIQMLQRFGIVATVIIIILLTFVMIKCLRRENYYLAIMLAVIAIRFFIDDLFLYLYYNSFWFVIGETLLEISPNKVELKMKTKEFYDS